MKFVAQPNHMAEQLDASGYHWNNPHNFKIRRVVEDFFRDLDTRGLTESEAQEVLRIIYALGSTMDLAPEGHTIARHMSWVPFQQGVHPTGTMCRIKLDAYEDDLRIPLNGKVGTVGRFLANGQVSVYLRTFGGSVQANPDVLEVVRQRRF